jgi:hypothetical protein
LTVLSSLTASETLMSQNERYFKKSMRIILFKKI